LLFISKKENNIYLFYIALVLNSYRKKLQSSCQFIAFGMLTILLITIPGSVLASSNSPYDSGYDHGCDDARISDPSDRYINQDEKGPAFHTSEFMNGYDSGFSSCSSYNNNFNDNNYSPRSSGGSETDCDGLKILGGLAGAAVGSTGGPAGALGGAAAGSELAGNLCE
jgi:hypothetical protein